ncbi:NACHT, LRR and PYD domains-containing protein 12-like [Alosa sapidissima]|uniref:NACHT, LRR and PYD domains-containing protein 12-like n=1 Tax=Alosa sapidissima TaxID=34773 RepID=UPI001C0A5B1D|nr:NACHT, LRR and PYD domains-containing protein 12-like [Alosa sapidissima]
MDFPQDGEDAVGGNQTGRAACAVSSHVSLKNEEPVTHGHQGVSKGQVLCSAGMDDLKQPAGQDDQTNKMMPSRGCNTLQPSLIRQCMRETLDDLSDVDLKRFKSICRDNYKIPWGKLEKADRDDMVEQMVQKYCEDSDDVMLKILRIMKNNQLVTDLERKLGKVNARPQNKEEKSSFKHRLQSILIDKYFLVRQELGDEQLQDIYTDLCIVEGRSGGVNSAHEVSTIHLKQIETRTLSGTMNSVKLSNIFTDHNYAGKPVTKVLTLGIAGVGKSVAVQKFVLDWAEDRENKYIELVFVLPFRELNLYKKDYSLFDLLLKLYPELEELNEAMELKKTVLFVLDGLDESRIQLDFNDKDNNVCDPKEKASVAMLTTSLITGKLVPSALIWVTTRPAAANKDLCDLFHLVTEIQGFNEGHREEYFRKVLPEKAEQIIARIKSKRSLYIMCHIPVFCRITAVVLGAKGKEQRASHQEMPKTLTEMYAQFSVFQITSMTKYQEEKMSPEEKGQLLVKLGKLAFKHLEKGTLIFYEKDLKKCEIDVNIGTLQAGLCTKIFKEESAISGESIFSFVHLSVQEFLAALYLLHRHAIDKKNLFIKTPWEKIRWLVINSRFDLYKMSLKRALLSENGQFDLCVRFLLGLAPMLEPEVQFPLNDVLPRLGARQLSIKKMVEYIKKKISENIPPERIINLFHCLNELGDDSLVEEINRYMSSAGEEKELTPAQCSALTYLLLMSAEELELDLRKYQRSEEGLHRMLPAVNVSRRVWLNQCHLSKASCEMMASVLQRTPSHLRELDMSDNDLQDEGVELLCVGLSDPQCKLETLRLKRCKLSKMSCKVMASVLERTPSHLRELDMSDNDLQDEGVKLLCVGLRDPQCKLEILRLSGCLITQKGCAFLSSALKSHSSYLKQLDLSYNHPGDSGVRKLTERLDDPNCKLETFRYDYGGEFRIKPGPRKYACELTLDPNTACRTLSLSEGNRKVTCGSEQPYPDHPERFDSYPQVLCREALSGRCYWEAEWSGHVYIAVAYKSMERKGRLGERKGRLGESCVFGRNAKSWRLQCFSNSYSVWHNYKETAIPAPSSRSSRVGVYLDWSAGTLSFYSVYSNTLTHLHTFHSTFTEPLYPGFRVYNSSVSLCQIT